MTGERQGLSLPPFLLLRLIILPVPCWICISKPAKQGALCYFASCFKASHMLHRDGGMQDPSAGRSASKIGKTSVALRRGDHHRSPSP